MTEDQRADGAEEHLSEHIDDLVPSHGYGKVPVVGLGGSAGSIEALQSFFATMPPQPGLAFVVVIHLSPDRISELPGVLQRCTRMRVIAVEGALKVEPNTVYVIPPGRTLQSIDGELALGPIDSARPGHVVIDIFFRTLADSHGAHAAAVVLSGMNHDGAIGIKRIKERGGLTVAQDPQQAEQREMPQAAIATGMVDWVLPVEDMASRLLAYFRLESAVDLPPEDGPEETREDREEAALRDVLAFLRTRTGRDFAQYKRATVLRRIGRRMQVNGVDNLPAYLSLLRTRPGECKELLQDLLISVTNFFRDAECFRALEAHIPSLFQGKRPGDAVRVWVVACATGEEAYSIAILLAEHARKLEAPPLIQVFATDLDDQAVQAGRDGIYSEAIEADVSEERLRRYFVKEHRGYRVRRELRELVLFAVHDVLHDSPFSRLDLVSCRNLLIYLTREAQARVFETLHFSLVANGRLFLGSSESVDDGSPLFGVLDKKHRIYAARVARRVPLPLPQASAAVARAGEAQNTIVPVLVGRGLEQPLAAPVRPADIARLSATTQAAPARQIPWGELHLELLERLAPPSVLVNSEYDVLHLSASAGRFLHFAGGEPSRNLLKAVEPALRLDLRAALYQAGQQGGEVVVPGVQMQVVGGTMTARVRVMPVTSASEQYFLLMFESEKPGEETPESTTHRLTADPLSHYLDAELERLKTHLRETVEQYEASTEELKASNEELQAMNEELRAAGEELETSREELQSINEELTTVNSELKVKVDELSSANSDMQNLMDATQIATIFLDRDLHITRFTPRAVSLFNLIPGDVGRPLTDMATQLDYPQLGADAARVLERLVPIEREVGQSGGNWYLARLMPYRTVDDRIGGVVFTFIDITERKRAEEMRLWLSAVVSATSDAIISFSLDRTILSWNGGAQRLFGYAPDEAIGRPLALLGGDAAAQEQVRIAAETGEGRAIENLETVRRRKDGSEVHVAITVSPIRDSGGRVVAGTAIIRDITAARATAEALRQSEERLRMVVESAVEYAIFSTDLERRITSWNSGAQRLLGFRSEEVLGELADVIFTPEDRQNDEPEKEARTARREGRASDERTHLRKDGSRFRGSGTMMLMRNQAGEATGFVKVLRDLSRSEPEPSKA